jgi:hypothetical protein
MTLFPEPLGSARLLKAHRPLQKRRGGSRFLVCTEAERWTGEAVAMGQVAISRRNNY